jgi:hypothetical protein
VEKKDELQAEISALAIIRANIKSNGVVNLSQYRDRSDDFQAELAAINKSIEDYASNIIRDRIDVKREELHNIKPLKNGSV